MTRWCWALAGKSSERNQGDPGKEMGCLSVAYRSGRDLDFCAMNAVKPKYVHHLQRCSVYICNLAQTMERVCDDHAPVIITRKAARPVIMMSLDDYEALEETAYLLRSPKNARRLLESMAELAAGKGIERELAD